MSDLFGQVEPVLAFAREALREGRLHEARIALEACWVFLRLHAPAHYCTYNPAQLIQGHGTVLTDETHVLDIEPVSDCLGAPDQVVDCLRQLVHGAELEEESLLAIEVFEEDVPCVALSFDGPGRFPREFPVDGFVPLTLEELGQRWTLATRGGRIDDAPNGLLLRLEGMRVPPGPATELEPLFQALQTASQCLQADDAGPGCLDQCLRLVEGPETAPEPVGLGALIGEVMGQVGPSLRERGISIETMVDPSVPPILLRRERMCAFFTNLARYAMALLPKTGSLTVLLDYDRCARSIEILTTIQGSDCAPPDTFYVAALHRIVAEHHQGDFQVSPEHDGVTLTATLPDPVGRTLDRWIPGFDAFSEQSQKMLRLLKSGGQAPPEELLLGGILEAELERWLLPRLVAPAAVNIAHELPEENPNLPGSSPPRLKKALSQIRRGKPRKEITTPPYAAELLWAFAHDARHRQALGTETLDDPALERLCLALLHAPPDCIASLRIIAQAIPSANEAAPVQ